MKYILPTIILFFVVLSCQKDDHPCNGSYTPGSDVPVGPSLASYQFKENTYWVYQNDSNNQIDSQRVESTYSTSWFSGGGSSSCSGATTFHEYHMTVSSSLTNEYFGYYLIAAYLYKGPTSAGNFSGKYIFNNLNSFDTNSGAEQLEIIPSMTLNGNNLTNVKKILVKHSTGQNTFNLSDHDMHFYFADSIGIVKWEVVDGSTILESWSIQSWDVVL